MMTKVEVPMGWVYAAVSDVVASDGIFTDGDWVETKDQDPSGCVRLIQLADVGDGIFLDKSSRFLTKTKAHELNCTFLTKGDLLVARMPGPLGRCCIFPLEGVEKYVTVVDVCAVRLGSSPIPPKYMMYLINSPNTRADIEALQSGSTRKRISRRNFASVEVPLAPQNEQVRLVAKIEELFSELDKGVESLKKARTHLDVYRQAVLKHAFEGRLTAKWREENKNHLESSEQLLDRIKQEREARYERQLHEWKTAVKDWETRGRIRKKPAKPQRPNWQYNRRIERGIGGLIVSYETANMLPAGWTECSIGEVTLPVSKIVPKAHPNREIDYIDISSIDNARHVIGSVKQYRLEDAPSRARQIVRTGDVLFATVRPYLRNIASVPDEYDQQIASTGFSVLRPAEGVCPAFLFYKAISRDLVNALSGVQYGVSYPAIRDEQVRDQTLWLPPTDEQHRIVAKIEERFSKVEKALEIIDTQMTKAKMLRQSILKKAFTGRLVAQNPYDEPASVLLHRIRAERDLVAKKNTPKKTKKRTTTT